MNVHEFASDKMVPRVRVKFAPHLARLVATGSKTTTWRIPQSDKRFRAGDQLELHTNEERLFGVGRITEVDVVTFDSLRAEHFVGHESFSSREELLATYQLYYPDVAIGPDTEVEVIHFNPELLCPQPGSEETDVVVFGRQS